MAKILSAIILFFLAGKPLYLAAILKSRFFNFHSSMLRKIFDQH